MVPADVVIDLGTCIVIATQNIISLYPANLVLHTVERASLLLKFRMLNVLCSILIINLVSNSVSECVEKDRLPTSKDDMSTPLFNFLPELMTSFRNFADKLKKFIRLPLNKIESRRRIVKAAFLKFLTEATKDENKGNNTNKLQHHTKFISPVTGIALIRSHGYIATPHKVFTTDGYVLTLYRIFENSTEDVTKSKIVLLHHGLLGSSDDWFVLGPQKALPYLLLDDGFDVWLANARGNKYSRAHVSKNLDSTEFWDFSWHEIGQYDLSATIDYIRIVTEGQAQIDFIGHSLGCTALLVLLATSPQYNYVLKSATFLGPLAFMYQTSGLLKLLAEFQSNYGITALDFLGETEFMPNDITFPRQVIERFCTGDQFLCFNPWLLLANGGQGIQNKILQQHILNLLPAGTSTKTIKHYCQSVTSGQFQMFDFGPIENMKKYGMKSPPVYRLNDVTLPVSIFSSSHDSISTIPDVISLLPNIPNPVVHHVIKRYGFSHTDFVWAEDAPHLLYHIIIGILKELSVTEKSNI